MKNHFLTGFTILIIISISFLSQSCTTVDINEVNTGSADTVVRIYLGLSPDVKQYDNDRARVEEMVRKHFDGATIQEVTGFYKGEKEKSLIITIINCCRWKVDNTDFRNSVDKMINEIKNELGQESILVELVNNDSYEAFEIYE